MILNSIVQNWVFIKKVADCEMFICRWGHDEYVYQMMKDHLPEEGLYMLRYHSFYAWHGKENTAICWMIMTGKC